MIDYHICSVHNRNYMLGQACKKLDLDTTGSLIILNNRIEVQVDLNMGKMDILWATQRHSKGIYVIT